MAWLHTVTTFPQMATRYMDYRPHSYYVWTSPLLPMLISISLRLCYVYIQAPSK